MVPTFYRMFFFFQASHTAANEFLEIARGWLCKNKKRRLRIARESFFYDFFIIKIVFLSVFAQRGSLHCDYWGAACHIQLSLSACQGLLLIGCCCSHTCLLEKRKTTTRSFQGAERKKKLNHFALLLMFQFFCLFVHSFHILATSKVSSLKMHCCIFCVLVSPVGASDWQWLCLKKCQTSDGISTAYLSITLVQKTRFEC